MLTRNSLFFIEYQFVPIYAKRYICCVPMCQPEPMCQPGCFEPICQPNRANVSTLNQYVNPAVPICQPVLIYKNDLKRKHEGL